LYQKIITKTRNWYTEESKSLSVEISKRKLDEYFGHLATELGIDTLEGMLPFSNRAIDWNITRNADYETAAAGRPQTGICDPTIFAHRSGGLMLTKPQ
jgi:hypothetical protein